MEIFYIVAALFLAVLVICGAILVDDLI